MPKKSFLALIPLALALAGCQGDPTNAPTADALEAANQKRREAIDNDPKLTPEQKEMMKSRISGVTSGLGGGQGQPPANGSR